MADNFDSTFDPFGEEFDGDDVINRGDIAEIESKKKGDKAEIIKSEDYERRKDPEFPEDKFTQDDLDKIIQYDDERRKKIAFQSKLDENLPITDEDPDLNNNFKDYIVAPQISGTSKFRLKSNRFEANKLRDSGIKTEITDDPHLFRDDHEKATILVNRDEKGDVDNIEIICTCGERILMKFDFAEVFDDVLTQQKIERVEEPRPFQPDEIHIETDRDLYPELLVDEVDDEGMVRSKSKALDKSDKKSEEEVFGELNFDDDEEIDMGDIDLSGI